MPCIWNTHHEKKRTLFNFWGWGGGWFVLQWINWNLVCHWKTNFWCLTDWVEYLIIVCRANGFPGRHQTIAVTSSTWGWVTGRAQRANRAGCSWSHPRPWRCQTNSSIIQPRVSPCQDSFTNWKLNVQSYFLCSELHVVLMHKRGSLLSLCFRRRCRLKGIIWHHTWHCFHWAL